MARKGGAWGLSTPTTATKNKIKAKMTIEDRLNSIEQLTLLAAKEALTMDDAAAYTGFSKATLYKLVHQKKIPYYKSSGGKLTYFSKNDLNAWLLNRRIASNEELEERAAAYVLNNPRKGGRK